MNVSLIATVKNEGDNIAALLDSMLSQSRPPDEIVINDNGSSDRTVAIIQGYIDAGHPIRLVHGGHNIPSGRNNAIRHADGPLIASCDAGLTLPRNWLAEIIAPLESGGADVGAGFYRAAPTSLWEFALGATNYPDVEEVDPDTFLPAGQSVAFTKDAWEAVGGYPEWAATCEDLIFDLALKQRGYRFQFVPGAAVHFQPRSQVRAYVRQYYTYARGDGVAYLFWRRHAVRYAFYAYMAVVALLARRNPWAWLLALPPWGLHLRKPLRRTWHQSADRTFGERVGALALVPLIRLLGDGAKMVGYPVGLWLRLRGRAGPHQANKMVVLKNIRQRLPQSGEVLPSVEEIHDSFQAERDSWNN